MKYGHLLTSSVKAITARGADYGTHTECFERAAKIASTILGTEVSPYAIAIIFHSMKLARMAESPDNADHYIDGISYLAFAGEFCMAEPTPKDTADTEPTRIKNYQHVDDTARTTNGTGPQS